VFGWVNAEFGGKGVVRDRLDIAPVDNNAMLDRVLQDEHIGRGASLIADGSVLALAASDCLEVLRTRNDGRKDGVWSFVAGKASLAQARGETWNSVCPTTSNCDNSEPFASDCGCRGSLRWTGVDRSWCRRTPAPHVVVPSNGLMGLLAVSYYARKSPSIEAIRVFTTAKKAAGDEQTSPQSAAY
jgi:hypothetical protein